MCEFKAHGLRSMGLLFLIDEKEVQTHPPQWDGLKGSKKEEGNEGVGRAPAGSLRRSLWRALRQAQGSGFGTVSELAELAVNLKDREILGLYLHLP